MSSVFKSDVVAGPRARSTFESEPSDVWRDDYGRGGPVRSDEPERDWFFERGVANEDSTDAELDARRQSNALRGSRTTASFRGRGPKGYRPSDERIQELVCERVTEDPLVDASEISIVVECAIVKASGTVATDAMKQALIKTVGEVHGVIGFVDDVRIAASRS